jgi:hypothetical protein
VGRSNNRLRRLFPRPSSFTFAFMLRALISFVCTIYSVSAFSQAFAPPETGKTVDESFRVSLAQQLPDDCVAWHIKGVELDVIVAVGKAYVEGRATRNARSRAESEAFLALAKDRAKGSSGCVEFVYDDIAKYVFAFDGAVVTGQAVVLDGRNYAPAPYAVIRYFAEAPFGGHVTYAIPGQRPFRANLWWIR